MDFKPSLQIASQSSLDCSEAQGLVSSIYNTKTPVSLHSSQITNISISCMHMTHVVNTELIQGLGDLNLLLGVKKSIGELLTLTQGALDDLESRDIAQKVGNSCIVAIRVAGGGGMRVLASLDTGESRVRSGIYWTNRLIQIQQNPHFEDSKLIPTPLTRSLTFWTGFAPLLCPLGPLSAIVG